MTVGVFMRQHFTSAHLGPSLSLDRWDFWFFIQEVLLYTSLKVNSSIFAHTQEQVGKWEWGISLTISNFFLLKFLPMFIMAIIHYSIKANACFTLRVFFFNRLQVPTRRCFCTCQIIVVDQHVYVA